MKAPKLLSAVQPFIAATAVLTTAAILVVAIYFTLLDLEWIAFLAGTLFAAVLAVVSRATRAEASAAARGKQLAVSEDRLSQETERREKAEAMLERANARLRFADDIFPAMVCYVDGDGIYRYHNHAFGRWVDLPPHRIDGHHQREVLGGVVYAQIEAAVARAFGGETVRYENTLKMANGAVYRLNVQHLPIVDGRGKPGGFFAVLTDMTEHRDVRMAHRGEAEAAPGSRTDGVAVALAPPSQQEEFDIAVAEHATGLTNARERILAAIERNEFTLFCQAIKPLGASSDDSPGLAMHYEILIRLQEEESNLIPPGAFFPLAEEQGLLPHLDRWVVANLLKWLAANERYRNARGREVFFINIATATLADPDFPDYVALQLHKTGLPGSAICFEFLDSDLAAHHADIENFARMIKKSGCRLAVSGFGRERLSVDSLKNLPLDFLKIDGSIILQILKDAVAMGKVVAITRVANAIGMATIAEMAEDDATVAKLREFKVGYAQGFGISRPQPLAELA